MCVSVVILAGIGPPGCTYVWNLSDTFPSEILAAAISGVAILKERPVISVSKTTMSSSRDQSRPSS